jgi:ribosomal protein L37AE/L43A
MMMNWGTAGTVAAMSEQAVAYDSSINERFERTQRLCHKCSRWMHQDDAGLMWTCGSCGESVRDHVSYSALQMWHKCPQQFHLTYLQDEVKPAMPLRPSIGGEWHEWQHQYAEACRKAGRERDFDAARMLMAPYSDRVRTLAREFMHNYTYQPDAWRGRGGSEISRRVPLGDDLPDYVCRIDNLEYNPLDKRLTITDFKTPPSQAYEHTEMPPTQLYWYAWAACESEADMADVWEVDMIRWIVPDSVQQSWTMSPPFPGAKQQIVEMTEQALRATQYPATPSVQACTYCPYYHVCQEAQDYELTAPQGPEAAAELVTEVAALRAEAAKLKDMLSTKKLIDRARKTQEWIGKLQDEIAALPDISDEERASAGAAIAAMDVRAARLQELAQDYVFNVAPIEVGSANYSWHYPAWHEKGEVRAAPSNAERFTAACQQEGRNVLDYVAKWDETKLGRDFGPALTGSLPGINLEVNPFGDDEQTVREDSAIARTLQQVVPKRTWGSRQGKTDGQYDESVNSQEGVDDDAD